ncbi:uncharacterized protein SOCE836_036270 [Sorangium cellulosum]|uniref:TauD/TfdA-like domain-containing protein n=1 Tax=Sorangium cellulosum TaxID=56 RepID=A0A4P2QNI3_SORCE|nr:uncharacterized protein SOCE836_036270 [Sorangium cellulosum]WCQ90875.1 hypothetical protein NQZ70_03589 [Sorangium sp. Soce836]
MKPDQKKQIAPPFKDLLGGVRCSVRFPEHGFILQLEPTGTPESIARWIQEHEQLIGDATLEYGGILFHGFDLDVASFRRLVGLLSDEIRFDYIGGTGPRERYSDDVYVSTYAPPGVKLAQHHEMAYMPSWPMKVFFYCDLAPRKDGETLVCSSRNFQRSLDPRILERFHDRKVLYTRNYDPPTDLKSAIVSGWQLSFNTSDKGKVSEICRDVGLEAEWRGERLRTRNIAQGAAYHPITGELLLHNQSYLRTMASDVRGAMTPAVRLFEPGLSRGDLSRSLE